MEDVFVSLIEKEEEKGGSRMNFRRTRAIARKEMLHILRDSRSLVAALLQPLVMLLIFGWALSLDVDRIPTFVYDLDQTPAKPRPGPRTSGARAISMSSKKCTATVPSSRRSTGARACSAS